MSPEEQLDIIRRQEEKMRAMQPEPNERDLEVNISEFSYEVNSFKLSVLFLIQRWS